MRSLSTLSTTVFLIRGAINTLSNRQNVINLPKWDINYGLQMSYTQYQRDGKMRNGRAPSNSLGKSDLLRFDNAALKVGAMYKLDGRNQFSLHAQYGTQAPLSSGGRS